MSPAAWLGGSVLAVTGLVTLWAWVDEWRLNRKVRRTMLEQYAVEFIGGPKDGELLVWPHDEFTVVTVRPVALSPWGGEREEDSLWQVVREGVYVRRGDHMEWRPE